MTAPAAPAPKRDLLLGAAQVIIILCCTALLFAMILVGIGAGAIATVGRPELVAKLAAAGAPAFVAWLLFAALLVIEGLLYMALRFLLELRGIVSSVGEGDPFHPENARRLSRMGWLALIGQILVLPLGALAAWLQPFADKLGDEIDVKSSFGLDGGTILLILILFILARVFQRGTAMRDELEGTV